MIRFGPAGNSESFYAQGYKHSHEAPAWLESLGLTAYEYSFGRGVSLGQAAGEKIAQQAAIHGVQMSAHAPYFINLAVQDDERREKNVAYFLDGLRAARYLGATRMVFHPGSAKNHERGEALAIAQAFLKEILCEIDRAGYGDIALCPETMGKIAQLGDLSEVLALCTVDERLIPAIDFGHLYARSLGNLRTYDDYAAILDAMQNALGYERTKRMHVHFSRIEFTKAGEKKHLTFEDTLFGPDFAPLAQLLAERKLEPVIICESKGTMAEDALAMKQLYQDALQAF